MRGLLYLTFSALLSFNGNPLISPGDLLLDNNNSILKEEAETGLFLHNEKRIESNPNFIVASGAGLFLSHEDYGLVIYDNELEEHRVLPNEVIEVEDTYESPSRSLGIPAAACFSHGGEYAWVAYHTIPDKIPELPLGQFCDPLSEADTSQIYRIHIPSLTVETAISAGSIVKDIAVSPNQKFILASNWCSGDLSIINTQLNSLVKTVPLGSYPTGIAVDRKSKFAYVAVSGESSIAVISLEDFTVSWLERIGSKPTDLCISQDGAYLYASLQQENKIVKIDLMSHEILNLIPTAKSPGRMMLQGDYLYVTHQRSNILRKIRCSDMKLIETRKTREEPISITYDSTTKQIAIACYKGKSLTIYNDDHLETASPDLDNTGQEPESNDLELVSETIPDASVADIATKPDSRVEESTSAIQSQNNSSALGSTPKAGFHLIIGSFKTVALASDYAKELKRKHGINPQVLPPKAAGEKVRLSAGGFTRKPDASKYMDEIKRKFGLISWILNWSP